MFQKNNSNGRLQYCDKCGKDTLGDEYEDTDRHLLICGDCYKKINNKNEVNL